MSKMNETTTGAGPTPGPWTAPNAGIWTADGECLIATLGNRECVASRRAYARKHYGDGPTSTAAEMRLARADAALLAASPAMLQALQAIVDLGSDHGRMNLPECMGLARAAIRAAEGGAA